jgi:hypothetical protein
MGENPVSKAPEKPPEQGERSAARAAFDEIHAAVEALNRDQLAAITEHAYERAAELRERAETLRRRKDNLMRECQQPNAVKPAE